MLAADSLAIKVWNDLSNGQGGIDWAGLPLIAGLLGIEDIDGLVMRLRTIKAHANKRDE